MNGTDEDHTPNDAPEEGASDPPTRVPARANRAGERPGLPARWSWADPAVWTERMVRALEDGVKGSVWPSHGRTLSSSGWGCSRWPAPQSNSRSHSRGERASGEPDARNSPVRFGGGDGRSHGRPSLPRSISVQPPASLRPPVPARFFIHTHEGPSRHPRERSVARAPVVPR